jgi:hypothetical protein
MSIAPIDLNCPRIGWYKTKLVKGGPVVPARIARICRCTLLGGEECPHAWTDDCDRYPRLTCVVNGIERNPLDWWVRIAKHPIAEDEYNKLEARRTLAERFARSSPAANPRRAIDLDAMPSLF